MRIIILEDDRDRRIAMMQRLADRFPFLRTDFFDSSSLMIQHMQSEPLHDVVLISLDHDLELIPGGPGEWVDPGTGLIAAKWLAQLAQPLCPVIVATTNVPAGDKMVSALDLAGWSPQRVTPHDDVAWVSSEWFPLVRNAIVEFAPGGGSRADESPDITAVRQRIFQNVAAKLCGEFQLELQRYSKDARVDLLVHPVNQPAGDPQNQPFLAIEFKSAGIKVTASGLQHTRNAAARDELLSQLSKSLQALMLSMDQTAAVG